MDAGFWVGLVCGFLAGGTLVPLGLMIILVWREGGFRSLHR